jgi:hypothetical protein
MRAQPRRRWVRLGAIFVATIPLLMQVAAVGPALDWGQPGSGDYAGLEFDVRTALHGDLLLGSSSRLGVRNLGPVHAYWTAPWYAVTGHGIGGMVLAAWLAHLVAIVAVVLMVRSVAGDRAAWLAAVAVAVAWMRAGPGVLSDFYNPALTVPAVLVATVAAAAVARGRWRWLPLAIAAASIGAQLHLVAAPALVVVTAAGALIGRRVGKAGRRELVMAAVVFVLLWAPTAVDQLTRTGNVSRVASAVASGPESADQPFGKPSESPPQFDRGVTAAESLTLTAGHAAAYGSWPGLVRSLGSKSPRETPIRAAVAAGLLALAVCAAWQNRTTFGGLILGLGLLGGVTTYLVTATVRRGFFPYYLAPLPGYAIALVVGAALLMPRDRMPQLSPRVAIVTTLTVGLLALAVVLRADVDTPTVLDIDPPAAQVRFAEAVADLVPEDCRQRGVALTATPTQTIDTWTIMVALDQRGLPVTVPDDVEPFVGPGHHRTGREVVDIVVPLPAELTDATVPAGSVTVGRC